MPPFPPASTPEAGQPSDRDQLADPTETGADPNAPLSSGAGATGDEAGAATDGASGATPDEPSAELKDTAAEEDADYAPWDEAPDLEEDVDELAGEEYDADGEPDFSADEPPLETAGELDEEALDDEDEPDSFRAALTSELARRAELSVLNGMEHVADTFDETAERIRRLASLRGGPEALSIGPVHSTVGWLEGAADYLRSSDLETVQSDLRHRVRARPVQSLGIALCAGWFIGRILR